MKKTISLFILVLLLLPQVSNAETFDAELFSSKLIEYEASVSAIRSHIRASRAPKGKYGKQSGQAGQAGQASQQKPPQNDEFVWLTAEKVNKQIDVIIKGIENLKGIIIAAETILNLYESKEISVDVAITMTDMLKFKALTMKFTVKGDDATKIDGVINILTFQSDELSKHKKQGCPPNQKIIIDYGIIAETN
ncbi:MAG: hypothetical protein GX221_10565 [Candidatus Riflebacteria bacterium]|nr:hypothetical protein [Candidatus Riflebacteria bacterium]